jgi:hypothetical protein
MSADVRKVTVGMVDIANIKLAVGILFPSFPYVRYKYFRFGQSPNCFRCQAMSVAIGTVNISMMDLTNKKTGVGISIPSSVETKMISCNLAYTKFPRNFRFTSIGVDRKSIGHTVAEQERKNLIFMQ